jgi:putative sigma-54 modulation protein
LDITISSRNTEVSEDLKAYAQKKIEKLPRYYDRIQKVHLTLHEERNLFHAELVLQVPHSKDIVVSESSDEMRTTVDLLLSKTERQLKKFKEKLKEHPRGKKAIVETNEEMEEA